MEEDPADAGEEFSFSQEEEGGGGGGGGGEELPFLPPFLPFLGVGEVLFEGAADALEEDEGVAPGLVGEVEGEEAQVDLCVCVCVNNIIDLFI